MRIIKAFPPNYLELREHFPIAGKQGILYSWGDRLYNPSGIKVEPWLLAHEEVHGNRQGFDVEEWWHKYIQDRHFRLDEELRAHAVEYYTFKAHWPKKPQQQQYLDRLATRISGPLYGNLISFAEARNEIANGSYSPEHAID